MILSHYNIQIITIMYQIEAQFCLSIDTIGYYHDLCFSNMIISNAFLEGIVCLNSSLSLYLMLIRGKHFVNVSRVWVEGVGGADLPFFLEKPINFYQK